MDPEINFPQVSIVITTYNRCNVLKRCLDAIADSNYPKELLELIVLDDASNDFTPEEIPKYLKQLKEQGIKRTHFFRNEQNLGIIKGRYILSQKVSPGSEMVLFVDDDAYLESECLKALVEYMLNHYDVGIVGPRIVYAKNPRQTAHNANFVGGWTAKYWSKDSSQPVACDWVNSTCCLVRKEALEKIGGFYPEYYIAHAEVDFCLRAKKAGFQVVYYPEVIAQHEEDLNQVKRERLYYLYRNKLLLIHRNFPFIRKVTALSFILFFGLPKYLLESVKFHRRFVFAELGLIVLSVWHGFLYKTGKREKTFNGG